MRAAGCSPVRTSRREQKVVELGCLDGNRNGTGYFTKGVNCHRSGRSLEATARLGPPSPYRGRPYCERRLAVRFGNYSAPPCWDAIGVTPKSSATPIALVQFSCGGQRRARPPVQRFGCDNSRARGRPDLDEYRLLRHGQFQPRRSGL